MYESSRSPHEARFIEIHQVFAKKKKAGCLSNREELEIRMEYDLLRELSL